MENQFWITVDIHEGKIEDVIADMKELLNKLQKDYLKESTTSMAAKIGYKPDSLRTLLSSKGEPYVGISVIKKICDAYGLKCELKIYKP